jgi:hypothetical protein
MEDLTMFGSGNTPLSMKQRLHQLLLAKILFIASIIPVTGAFADSASAPLGVTVTVVRSCNVSTAPSLTGRYTASLPNVKTDNTPNPIVSVLCPRGFDPAIAVKSIDYPVRLATTETTTSDENKRSLTISPVASRDGRVISLPEQLRDGEKGSKGSYTGNLTITVNF